LRFSETFEINRDNSDDWFDTVLVVDTPLFIDPFLIYATEEGPFIGSHTEIISYFNDIFTLIARTEGNSDHLYWKRSEGLLIFPEAEELCLGYACQNTKGAGSGRGFSRLIAAALWQSVEAGIQELTHFEEIGILSSGIGADRISDITANILRHRFISYTLDICNKHEVPTEAVLIPRGRYDSDLQRWLPYEVELPVNPYNDKPILLCPTKYLDELPMISGGNFWHYCYDYQNEMLRNDFGADITRNVDKETIVSFAKRHPDIRGEFIQHVEQQEPVPYDQDQDRKGLVSWFESTSIYCRQYPVSFNFQSSVEFQHFVRGLLDKFRNYVENNGGWQLLWNDNGTPKSEAAAQRLFLGIVGNYCSANNIDISKEVNIGRGPVDFKVSHGYEYRALIELKLVRNGKFWNGLERQLPKYLEAERVEIGYFVVVIYTENDLEKLNDIQDKVSEVNNNTGYSITVFTIDAQHSPVSASNL